MHHVGSFFGHDRQEGIMTPALIASQQRPAFAPKTSPQRFPWRNYPEREDDSKDREMAIGTDQINGSANSVLFGPFRLLPMQRLLMSGDKPVQVGSRAFDILVLLLERPGELVTKGELMARVWPNTFVEPANLFVHIAGLRRVLGDGRGGNRYVVNIPGRGYRFVAPVTVARNPQALVPCDSALRREHNLPAHLTQPIGRSEIIDQLAAQVSQGRLLSIVGPGGTGKTTIARAVAEKLTGLHEHGVWLVDLASIKDPSVVPSTLAAVLGVEAQCGESVNAVATALEHKQVLLVFDNCEQVIASAAELATCILRAAPGVQILATSREPLRGEGERVFRLPPLPTPPASTHVTAREAISFPAVQLFAERAANTLGEFELTDRDAPMVAEICRKLDGLPLAIELAAARLDTLGLQGVAECIDDCLDLLTQGRRTDLPRQQSLRATLDWSHALLSDAEQIVFRRFAIFTNNFTLGDAFAVAADAIGSVTAMRDVVAALVAKSLVVADLRDGEPNYYLLSTIRAYALSKLVESDELDKVRRSFADCCRDGVDVAAPTTAAGDGSTRLWSA
jgi:predicted ATPase/DNA-binding winged helix-turn-helix (wHTH) protein